MSKIWNTLKLLLPALLPSWRFFDSIAPSPRIQFTLLSEDNEPITEWHEFRQRPVHVPIGQMLAHLFWNPIWNESLFLVSCAERIIENPTQHSEDEILRRISYEILSAPASNNEKTATHLQFRLLLVQRLDRQLVEEVVFHSRIKLLPVRDTA